MHTCGNSVGGGGGGASVPCKNGKSREVGGGVLSEIPSVVGVWIFYESNFFKVKLTDHPKASVSVSADCGPRTVDWV